MKITQTQADIIKHRLTTAQSHLFAISSFLDEWMPEKAAAFREAHQAVLSALSHEDLQRAASTQNYDRACEFCGHPCWVDPDDRDAPQDYCTHCHLRGGEAASTQKEPEATGKEDV